MEDRSLMNQVRKTSPAAGKAPTGLLRDDYSG
jgi:hypothetical protein